MSGSTPQQAYRSAKSPRIKRNKVEVEFEKYRLEERWDTILEVIKTGKLSKSEFVRLCEGEALLEKFLLTEYAGPESVVPADVLKILKTVHKSHPDDLISQLDSGLLLAKGLYYSNLYQDALTLLDDLCLDKQTGINPSSITSRLISEGFAIKGICLEKLPGPTAPAPLKDRRDSIISSYERAGDLYLRHLHELPASIQNLRTVSVSEEVGHALQQSAILRMRYYGDMKGAICRLRQILRVQETRCNRSIRQTLSRELAEILLRGVSPISYTRVEIGRIASGNLADYMHPIVKDTQIPSSSIQECILLLLISEYIACQQAVLSRDKDISVERAAAFENTVAVYDLFCIVFSKLHAYRNLADFVEHAMKFSFGEHHIWLQFGLAQISAGRLNRGLAVLEECYREAPLEGHMCLLAAKAAFEAHKLHFGMRWVERAGNFHRAQLFAGVGHLLMAQESRSLEERKKALTLSASALQKACDDDPIDYLAFYHRALCLAEQRNLNEACKVVKQSLNLNPEHGDSAHLLALIYTGLRQWDAAERVLSYACKAYPRHASILLTRARLAAYMHGPKRALPCFRNLFVAWRDKFGENADGSSSFVERWVGRLGSEMMERDPSIKKDSILASRIETAFSEFVTGTGSDISTTAVGFPSEAQSLQVRILLSLAELYLDCDLLAEAADSISECEGLVKLSHHVLHLKARLLEAKGLPLEAIEVYQDAVAINQSHIRSLQNLGLLLIQQKNLQLAEKLLRDAVNYQPTSSRSWSLLGQVLSLTGQELEAADCFFTAVELEQAEPFEPFYFLPKGIPA